MGGLWSPAVAGIRPLRSAWCRRAAEDDAMRQWVLVGCLAVGLACAGDSGPGVSSSIDSRRKCSQLEWHCGIDDYGGSCGTCPSGTTCNRYGSCTTGGDICRTCTGVCAVSDGCGGWCNGACSGGRICSFGVCVPDPTPPTPHNVDAARLQPFTGLSGVPFTVPWSTVTYTVTSPGGTYDVGIFVPTEWARYAAGVQSRAHALRENVRDATVAVDLPGGDYMLGFRCRNPAGPCDVSYAISASY